MNYCHKEEFLPKLVHRDLGDINAFYSAKESMSLGNIPWKVKKKVRS